MLDHTLDASPPLRHAVPAQHYRVLDTYRFLAATGVVFYHFENHFQHFLPAPTHLFERLQFFVDFFFVLSGFVLMHTYGGRPHLWAGHKDFLWKRFARLYPLHLATMLVCCVGGAIVYVVGLKVSDPSFFDLSLVPSNLLLIHAWGVNDHPGLNGPSWSLSAEAFVYILFPLLALLLARTGPVITIAVAVVMTAVTGLVRAKAGLSDASLATYDFGNLRALPAFLAGMATCTIVNRLPRRRIEWWIPNLVAVVVLASMLMDAPVSLILCLFPLLVGLVAMAERGGATSVLASPFFVLLGNASFAIYLTHTYFQVVSVSVVRKMGWTSLPALTGVSLVFFVAIVGSSVLSYRYFETPMRKALIRRRPFGGASDAAGYRANGLGKNI